MYKILLSIIWSVYKLNIDKVSTILKKGNAISTILDSSYVWQQNIIERVEKNIIYISLLESYVSSLIMQGSNIMLRYSTEYYEYLFEGTILNINLNTPGYVAVRLNKADEKINTRAFIRYDIYLPSNIKPQNERTSYFSIVTNISLQGMSFTSNHSFDYNNRCDTSIYLPDNTSINLVGVIKRKVQKDTLIDYGMLFDEISEKDTHILSKYISTLEKIDTKTKLPFFE